jgi:4-amino-4-deoxy-L-arabinose transferase-like glycosyltransferase
MRAPLLVTAICLVLFFTGLGSVPFYTHGEPREALVTREMLRTGEWLVPSRPEGELTRKPPLFYWVAASALTLFPDRPELAARLPSAVLGTIGVLVLWAAVQSAFGGSVAVLAALVLATTFEWTRAATVARVDMALAAGLTVVLGAWLVMLAGERSRPALLVLATAGVTIATLSKGPVAVILPALAVGASIAWQRDWSFLPRLRVLPVLIIGGMAAALWYGVAFAREGGGFLHLVVQENLLRFVDTADAGTGHAHGLGYLPLVGMIGLLPWTLLLPLACAPLADARRRDPRVVLLGAWVVVILVFFSIASAKRSVYLLPLFPALAVLLALGVEQPPSGRLARVLRMTTVSYAPALVILGVAACALASGVDVVVVLRRWLKPRDAQNTIAIVAVARTAVPELVALGLLAIGAAVLIARARRRADWRRVTLVLVAVTCAWHVVFGGFLHATLGRAASLAPFMTRVDQLVPPDAQLYTPFPPDEGLRFYAPRPLVQWKASVRGPAYLLFREDERRRWRDANGQSLEPLAVSEASEPRHGTLDLLLLPEDTQLQDHSVKTGSRSR